MSDDPAIPRVFYRIVWADPPGDDDFRSYEELGRDPRNDPEWTRLASGLSMYDSLTYARSKAKRHPWKGNCFIPEVRIPDDHAVHIEQTGQNGKQYTVWGDGALLRSMVDRVLPARRGGPNV